MKKKIISILFVAYLCGSIIIPASGVNADMYGYDSSETYTFAYPIMGIPDEICDYLDAHGLDWMNNDDLRRAELATGISSGTGKPLTPEGRRQIEASLGISSSAPAASDGQTSKPAPAAPKHEHSYQEEVTKEATCTETGEKTFTCDCGDSYTEEIAALGHEYTDTVTKEPTCTGEGEKTYTCTRCGDTYPEAVPAAGHKYADEAVVDTEPTCTATGESSRHCSVCDDRTDITEIPATGHEESGTYEVTTAATMFSAGEEVMKCSVCGEVIATRVIPQDTKSLYMLIGGIAAAVIAAIVIVVVMKKKKGQSAAKKADSDKAAG